MQGPRFFLNLTWACSTVTPSGDPGIEPGTSDFLLCSVSPDWLNVLMKSFKFERIGWIFLFGKMSLEIEKERSTSNVSLCYEKKWVCACACLGVCMWEREREGESARDRWLSFSWHLEQFKGCDNMKQSATEVRWGGVCGREREGGGRDVVKDLKRRRELKLH